MILDFDFDQRSTLFYTKCLINNKWCALKIDNGCSANLLSIELVNKLGLTIYDHPKPYELFGLNLWECLRVSKQVRIGLSMGSYVDEIIFDIVPLVDCHLVLGRPWIFDRNVTHRGRANEYELGFGGKFIVLKPMSPQAIHDMLAAIRPNVIVLENDPIVDEIDCGSGKDNGVVEFSNSCYDSVCSLSCSLEKYSDPIHYEYFESRAVFKKISNVVVDNSIADNCSEDNLMQPIWDNDAYLQRNH